MPKKPKNLSTRISVPSLFVCLLSPAADRLKKREPGIGETLDNSHCAFEKRSPGGQEPTDSRRQVAREFYEILRALNAEVVALLSIGCRYIVAWWVGAGGSAGWRFGSSPVTAKSFNSLCDSSPRSLSRCSGYCSGRPS